MTLTKQNSGDLKTRVNTYLNKLSDRDTISIAIYELETVAKTISNDAFATFLTNLSATAAASENPPVRRCTVRLLATLSAAHGDALSPHVHRMIAAVTRRLCDPDSGVRAACVDAVKSIAAHVVSTPFSAIMTPLVDALFHEQDAHAQACASLCLAAAVGAAHEVEAAEIGRVLPRLLKLVKSDCFKAKPALLLFIGSVVDCWCVKSTKNSFSCLISTVNGFLSSEDWAARKAAAEVLEKVAVAEGDLAAEVKGQCLDALESRRFDKVKIVRDTMNKTLEIWKNVPDLTEESLPKDTNNNASVVTPQPTRKIRRSRSCISSSSSTTSSQKSCISTEDNKPYTCNLSKLDLKKKSRPDEVPFNCDYNVDFTNRVVTPNDNFRAKGESNDMSLIRKQLLQIEYQQSCVMDLLQRFIGSTQKGMSSLEKRVDGLEKVLDEMSHGLAISTKSISCSGNTCCMRTETEFLSPKFWSKTEGLEC